MILPEQPVFPAPYNTRHGVRRRMVLLNALWPYSPDAAGDWTRRSGDLAIRLVDGVAGVDGAGPLVTVRPDPPPAGRPRAGTYRPSSGVWDTAGQPRALRPVEAYGSGFRTRPLRARVA